MTAHDPTNSAASPQVNILSVCTGNICRSPYSERIIGMYFDPQLVRSHSAGLMAVVDSDMTPEVMAMLPEQGLAKGPHVARQITAEMVAEADIVLTATKEHRSGVVRLQPRAVRKVFTLLEAARMIMAAPELPEPQDPVDAVRGLAEFLSAARSHAPGQYEDDVSDPYRRGQAAFDAMKVQMDPALAVVVRYCIGQLHR